MFDFRTTKIGRFINQNMIGIGVAIVTFIMIIVVLQLLNEQAKNDRESVNIIATNIIKDTTSETIISGGDVSEEKNTENKDIIDSFIEYCNAQKIEEAYNLISQDCREELYLTIEDFTKLYWSPIFKTSKSYSMQSWISYNNQYTYKVRLLEDMLATGKYNNSSVIEDYFTIVDENGVQKISINGYIGKEEINISKEENLNKFTIISKQVYMDYEVYTIEVQNNSNNAILLDTKETFRNTYLLGENETEYSSYIDEVLEEDLIIKVGETKTIDIKFNKMYNPSIKIQSIVFSDIIQDYDSYSVLENKEQYTQRLKLQIEI